jgi:hypothetical protein
MARIGRPPKSVEDSFYDVFASWSLADQKIALRVMERLVVERERDQSRQAKAASANGDEQTTLPGASG